MIKKKKKKLKQRIYLYRMVRLERYYSRRNGFHRLNASLNFVIRFRVKEEVLSEYRRIALEIFFRRGM